MAFLVSINLSAQVGIGTTNPTAELEIATTNTGLPALELNPQTAPTGTVTGQLAVIGNELFMYDANRGKWLGVGAMALQFGKEGAFNNDTLEFGGDLEQDGVGPLMPFNGTIVAVTATTYVNAGKRFQIRVRDYNPVAGTITSTQTYNFALTNYEYNNTSLNLDFNTNDFITIRGNGGGNAEDAAVVVWVKWRQ